MFTFLEIKEYRTKEGSDKSAGKETQRDDGYGTHIAAVAVGGSCNIPHMLIVSARQICELKGLGGGALIEEIVLLGHEGEAL